MSWDGMIVDLESGLACLDYFAMYQVNTTVHAQLYGQGLCRRIRRHVPEAHVAEYRPGITHVRLADYHEYQRVLSELMIGVGREHTIGRSSLRRAMESSLKQLRRANWSFEHGCGAGSLSVLLDAACEAMSFCNFNDETRLPTILADQVHNTLVPELQRAISPVVTPYMLILSSRASNFLTQKTERARKRFVNGVAFLRDFDTIDLDEEVTPEEVAVFGTQPVGGLCIEERRRRRARAMELLRAEAKLPEGALERFLDLVQLAAVAADHEESRHYWQARTMRNVRRYCAEHGLDIRTKTIDDLSGAGRVVGNHAS